MAWQARSAGLRDANLPAEPADALAQLHAGGWSDAAIATAATTTAFDLWRAFAVTYASAYARSGVEQTPGAFRFVTRDASGAAQAAAPNERAAWWADAAGIAPGAGVFIDEPAAMGSDKTDPTLRGQLQLHALWKSTSLEAQRLRASIAACAVRLPRIDLPVFVIHGREDGLVVAAFSSDPYIDWLREHDRRPIYWPLPHVQHFDSFLALPGFGDRYVPLLPYAYAALENVWRHLIEGMPLRADLPRPQPRGTRALIAADLGL
jgi:hydroxybutyrate-dimer hydrolase